MPKIDKEIEELAVKMEKSTKGPKQALFNTILELGPEGLKKAVAHLSQEEQVVLKATLDEMKKSTSMPTETPDAAHLTPETTKTPEKKMETESLSGSDNQDEKIMEDSNKEHAPQGGPKDKPEGWEGTIIKGREPQNQVGPSGAIIIGHTSTGKPMYANAEHPAHVDHSHRDHQEHAQKHENLASQTRSSMSSLPKNNEGMSEDSEKHMELYNQARMHENNALAHKKMAGKKEDKEMEKCYGSGMVKKSLTEEKADAKKEKPMNKSKKLKKSLKKIVKLAKALKMTKEEVVKAIKDSGDNLKLVKAELRLKLAKSEGMDSFTPNPEVSQSEPSSQDKKQPSDKEEKGGEDKGDLEIKAPKTADQALAEIPASDSMQKSINWSRKSSIAAGTLGRNVHYETVDMFEKSEKEKAEIIKSKGYFGEQEVVKKSETGKVDLNDLIEKGFDYSADEISRIQDIQNHRIDGIVLRKSFSDRELAAALGMDEKTYKELMGSDKE